MYIFRLTKSNQREGFLNNKEVIDKIMATKKKTTKKTAKKSKKRC